jgi:hypothetical protein
MVSCVACGTASALSTAGLNQTVERLGVDLPTVWALLSVETSGCGYLPDRRPTILYERHLFHKLTQGRFADGDISAPTAGGYGRLGESQYDRLNRAAALNRDAALKATSWGLGQVLGRNFKEAGYQNVEDMVVQMVASEDQQLSAVCGFIESNKLSAALRKRDWAGFASRYNGPAYKKNKYDVRLSAEYEKGAAGLLPDLNVRTAQLYLTYLGFHPGPVDGVAGSLTRSAAAEFQQQQGMPLTSRIDGGLVARLTVALSNAAAV